MKIGREQKWANRKGAKRAAFSLQIISLSQRWFADVFPPVCALSCSSFLRCLSQSRSLLDINEAQLTSCCFYWLCFWCHMWDVSVWSKVTQIFPWFFKKFYSFICMRYKVCVFFFFFCRWVSNYFSSIYVKTVLSP